MADLGGGDVESASQPLDEALDDTAFCLERAYRMKMQLSFHNTDNHKFSILGSRYSFPILAFGSL